MIKRTHSDYLNLYRSEAQGHFRTQKSIQKTKLAKEPALNSFKIFLSVNIWGWVYHYFKSRFGKKHEFVDYSRSASNGVFKMHSEASANNDNIKIVIAADWATDTAESGKIGDLMKNEKSDYSIHLGDTYFVGATPEIESNFIAKGASWPKGNSGSLALPGNHEFYSNGNPYFNHLLPQMFVKTGNNGIYKQDASFFCLENDYWRLIGLDTGYYSVGRIIIEWIIRPDAHLDDKLIDWLKKEVQIDHDNRGLIILSHHQYCSAFEERFTKAAEVLRNVFGVKKDVIWLWGHEHRFAVYGKYQSKDGIKAYGRCIGHGGMPIEIGKLKSGEEFYKGPDPELAKECSLIFWDSRKKMIIGDRIIGHNGYVVLTMTSNQLNIQYKDESTWLFSEEWKVDLQTGELSGTARNNPGVDLSLFANSYDDAVK